MFISLFIYLMQGTLAKQILAEPEEITAMNGQRLKLNMQVILFIFLFFLPLHLSLSVFLAGVLTRFTGF